VGVTAPGKDWPSGVGIKQEKCDCGGCQYGRVKGEKKGGVGIIIPLKAAFPPPQ